MSGEGEQKQREDPSENKSASAGDMVTDALPYTRPHARSAETSANRGELGKRGEGDEHSEEEELFEDAVSEVEARTNRALRIAEGGRVIPIAIDTVHVKQQRP